MNDAYEVYVNESKISGYGEFSSPGGSATDLEVVAYVERPVSKAESFQQHEFSISIVADFEKTSQFKAKAWGQNDDITVVIVRRKA